MTDGGAPGPSALRTWVMVLGFLAAMMVVLGTVAYFTGRLGHARSEATGATAPAGVRH